MSGLLEKSVTKQKVKLSDKSGKLVEPIKIHTMKQRKRYFYLKLLLVILVILLTKSNTFSQAANALYQEAMRSYLDGNSLKSSTLMDSIFDAPKSLKTQEKKFFQLKKHEKEGLNSEFSKFKSKDKYDFYLLAAQSALMSKKYNEFAKFAKLTFEERPLYMEKTKAELLPELRDYTNKHIFLPRLTLGLNGGILSPLRKVKEMYSSDNSDASNTKLQLYNSWELDINYWFLRKIGIGMELGLTKNWRNYASSFLNNDEYNSEMYKYLINPSVYVSYRTLHKKMQLSFKIGLALIQTDDLITDYYEKEAQKEVSIFEYYVYPFSSLEITQNNQFKITNKTDKVLFSSVRLSYAVTKQISLYVTTKYGVSLLNAQISDSKWNEIVNFSLKYSQNYKEGFQNVEYIYPSYFYVNIGFNYSLFNKVFEIKQNRILKQKI